MSAHPADVLAGFLARLRSPRCGEAADMLRTIPAMEAELAKLRADLEAMLPLLVDAESSLTDYQQDVQFGNSDGQTLRDLRAALRARGIT